MTAAAITAPIICPGSGEFIHEDTVDGNFVTLCPVCGRFTIAHPVPESTRFLAVQAHYPIIHPDLGIHSPACEVELHGACTCSGSQR